MRKSSAWAIFFMTVLLMMGVQLSEAEPITSEAALAGVAARYRGEALAIHEQMGGLVREVRWRTPQGNVLRIRVTGPGCRFLEVEGVGQSAARIFPGEKP